MTKKIGKYEVHEKIGVGGFGEVYKGYDPFIKRYVAIKTCSSSDQDIRSRFFQEAEIAGNLHHRNITTVYDFGIHDELPYLIQEYLSGEDLDRKVKRRDYLPFAEKLYYLLQIARGLGHAHSKGVIHRDIKPANIRILEDGTAKIMDFGIAKLAQQETGLTQTGMTLGTAAYLAPEQIRGEDVDLSTDVFAFGIMAFELLVYERPFQGKQISVVLHQILDREPPPVSEKWPAAPPEIVAFVDRCLKKDPTRRFADGNTLLKELERIQRLGRGEAAEHPEVDDRPTVQLAGQGAAASPPAAPPPPPPPVPATRPLSVAPGKEIAPPATAPAMAPPAGAGRRETPTLDDVEFSLSAGVEPIPAPPAAPARSRLRTALFPVLVLAVAAAVGGGWWLGGREGGLAGLFRLAAGSPGREAVEPAVEDVPPLPGSEHPGTATGTAGGDAGGDAGETGSGDEESDPGGNVGTATAEETPDAGEPEAGLPGEEAPAGPPEPPPPEPPAKGSVAIAEVGWTDLMTVTLAGTTYPLHRGREISLAPGSYRADFETQMADYPMRQTVTVTVEAGKRATLRSPIPRPGALSVRPLPRRPQGEVWVDGQRLQQSPVRKVKQAPGEYRIEIRPVGGGGNALSERFAIESGQETLLSFDLEQGELKKSSKPLDER